MVADAIKDVSARDGDDAILLTTGETKERNRIHTQGSLVRVQHPPPPSIVAPEE
jgi:hypothetical protein